MPDGMKLFRYEHKVYEKSAPGLTIQVIDNGGQRELRFGNHVTQSAVSLASPGTLLLDYSRAMAAGLLFAPLFERFLHIGLGGGAIPRCFHAHLPRLWQRVVELSPEVAQVAYDYFDLPRSPRLQVVVSEGGEFLRTNKERYHLIFLDAFHANGAAEHLNTPSFFNMLRAHLEPGGFLVNNVWGSDRPNLHRVRAALIESFPQLYHLAVRANSNVIFFAGRDARPLDLSRMRRRAEALSERMAVDFPALMGRVRVVRSPDPRREALA